MSAPKKGGLALILGGGRSPAEEEPKEEGGDSEAGEHDAAAAMIEAFHAKDAAALKNALCDFIDLHGEGHEEPDGDEAEGEEKPEAMAEGEE